MLNGRKIYPPKHHMELKGEQSHNRRHLEDMIASLLNHFHMFLKQNVQYAAWYSETLTNLYVAALTFVTHVVNNSNLIAIPVRYAGEKTLNSILTRAWNAPLNNFMFYAHAIRVVAHGEGNWGNYSTMKLSTLVSIEGVVPWWETSWVGKKLV